MRYPVSNATSSVLECLAMILYNIALIVVLKWLSFTGS